MIAAVNGFAIGGGHVLHVLCDVTIAADTARVGQTGPRVGSFDAGFGSAYLARIVGQQRAREIWMFCRQYDAATAERWGLVNAVVPAAELRATVRAWADEALALSPTALKVLKHSFNAETEHIAGVVRWRSTASSCSSAPRRARACKRSRRSARPTSAPTAEPRSHPAQQPSPSVSSRTVRRTFLRERTLASHATRG